MALINLWLPMLSILVSCLLHGAMTSAYAIELDDIELQFSDDEAIKEFVKAFSAFNKLCSVNGNMDLGQEQDDSDDQELLKKVEKIAKLLQGEGGFSRYINHCQSRYKRVDGPYWQEAIDGLIGKKAHPEVAGFVLNQLKDEIIEELPEGMAPLKGWKAVNFLFAHFFGFNQNFEGATRTFHLDRTLFFISNALVKRANAIAYSGVDNKSIIKTAFGNCRFVHYQFAQENSHLIRYILSRPFSDWEYIARNENGKIAIFRAAFKEFYIAALDLESKRVVVPSNGFMDIGSSVLVHHPIDRSVSEDIHSSWFLAWENMKQDHATIAVLSKMLEMNSIDLSLIEKNFTLEFLILRYVGKRSYPKMAYQFLPQQALLSNALMKQVFAMLLNQVKGINTAFGAWGAEEWHQGIKPSESALRAFGIFMEYIKFLGYSSGIGASTVDVFAPLIALGLSYPKSLWDYYYGRQTAQHQQLLDAGIENLFGNLDEIKPNPFEEWTHHSAIMNIMRPSWVREFHLESLVERSEHAISSGGFSRELWDQNAWQKELQRLQSLDSCEVQLETKKKPLSN